MTEDEMVGWHHHLNGHELSQLWEMVKDREAWGKKAVTIIAMYPVSLFLF